MAIPGIGAIVGGPALSGALSTGAMSGPTGLLGLLQRLSPQQMAAITGLLSTGMRNLQPGQQPLGALAGGIGDALSTYETPWDRWVREKRYDLLLPFTRGATGANLPPGLASGPTSIPSSPGGPLPLPGQQTGPTGGQAGPAPAWADRSIPGASGLPGAGFAIPTGASGLGEDRMRMLAMMLARGGGY